MTQNYGFEIGRGPGMRSETVPNSPRARAPSAGRDAQQAITFVIVGILFFLGLVLLRGCRSGDRASSGAADEYKIIMADETVFLEGPPMNCNDHGWWGSGLPGQYDGDKYFWNGDRGQIRSVRKESCELWRHRADGWERTD
jgi:hypothetical protein